MQIAPCLSKRDEIYTHMVRNVEFWQNMSVELHCFLAYLGVK